MTKFLGSWGPLIISVLSLLGSIWAIWYNRRSAASAKESASAARDSADSAAQVADAEVQRDHRDLAPTLPGAGALEKAKHWRRADVDVLFLKFTLPRTYRVAAEAVYLGTGSRSPLAVNLVTEAGQPQSVQVEELRKDFIVPDYLHFRFWPPTETDPGVPWTCRCGLPTDSESPAHWEWKVPIPPDIRHNPPPTS